MKDLYFFHIPKTAGVSIYHFLNLTFPPDSICPFWLWDHIINLRIEELSSYKVYRGHFFGFLPQFLERPLRMFTMLRSPVERAVSHYNHVRRAKDHPYHKYALAMPIEEFSLHPETRHMIDNFQARYLATVQMNLDLVRECAKFVADGPNQMQVAIERSLERYPRNWVQDAAMRSLDQMEFVGLTEAFDQSIGQLAAILDCQALQVERQNVSPDRMASCDLSSKAIGILEELTTIDRELYQRVTETSERGDLYPKR